MWDASDEALLAGLGAGDRTASVVFVRRFQRRVFGVALAVVRDEGIAAEVAQDAFVRAWRHAGSFDPRRGSAATWLLAITRNSAIDRLRMERARPADPIDPDGLLSPSVLAAARPSSPLAPSTPSSPEDAATMSSETDRVVAALGALPEPQRRCVVLATIGGYTAREISETENIPIGTAKTRLRAGLDRLRTLLHDPQQEEEVEERRD